MVAVVCRTWHDNEAQLIKGILELHGIPVRLDTDISHALYPFTVNGLGETRVVVPIAVEDEAQAILVGYLVPDGPIDAGGRLVILAGRPRRAHAPA